MEMLFSQEQIWELDRRDAWQEGRQEGEAHGESKRDALYGELLKILEPLGRIGDLIAATADKAKLSALAQEFGLEV